MWAILGAIVVLLAVSAFFSGAETALTAASRPLMHQLEQKGSRKAGLVNRLREHKEGVISSLLLGNNLVNILASTLAASALISLFGERGIAYATIAMTVLVVVFSEVMPKMYAIRNANTVAPAVAPVVQGIYAVLGPVSRTVNWLVRTVFRSFGVHHAASDVIDEAEQELRGAIELHQADEEAVKHERAMLRSVLDLDDVEVGEVMVHRRNVTLVNVDEPPEAVVQEVLASPYTRIPLYRETTDNIVGVLHVKALLRAVQGKTSLEGLDILALAAKPWFVPESTTLLDQLQAFRQRHEHFALVVDEYGSLMGIVTLEDILEEIVGDIADEHDVVAPGVRVQPDGSIVVHGQVTIRDLNRRFEWTLPDEEATTVAGLILHETRRIPEVGQAFLLYGFRFEILRRIRHQITAIRILAPPSAEGGGSEN